MSDFIEIVKSKRKPKEKTTLLAEKLKADNGMLPELIAYFPTAPVAVRGLCIEAISEITKSDPKFADSCLEFVIAQLNDKAPRVKWEAATVVANATGAYPERAARAIPALLKNTADEGTVVRWSAAKGLTEIAKAYSDSRQKLLKFFVKIISKEENNGVKNIYIQAVKKIEKSQHK